MATWKKVIVSGSAAELSQLNVGANQQITTTQATTFLTGSFTGSFTGNGAGLTGVTATAIFPTTAVTNITSTDKFFISQSTGQEFITYGNLLTDLAGTNLTVEGSDSLTLASQIAVTGISASFTGSLTGALIGTASWATNATNATNATTATNANNVAVTDTTTGTGPYYVMFADGTTGNRAVRVDSAALTFNATTNTLTVTSSYANQALSASFATLAQTANTASFVLTAQTASFVQTAQTASFVLTAQTASYVLNAVSSSFASTASFVTTAQTASFVLNAQTASFVTTAQTASFVLTAQTASYVLQAVSASFATTASYAASTNNITNAISNNTDNRLLTATGGGTINGESNLTFDGTTLSVTGNATLTGNLTVAGTASFTNTDNLNIRDKFILINSGSATLSDSGWITQYNAAGSGSAFYLDAGTGNDHGPYGRFAVAFDTLGTTTAPTVSEYVVTAKINQASNPSNAVPPTWGTGSNGSGNMWITNAGDIFIYG
jgi:hypothetical protein